MLVIIFEGHFELSSYNLFIFMFGVHFSNFLDFSQRNRPLKKVLMDLPVFGIHF